jgi:hypothetical protein
VLELDKWDNVGKSWTLYLVCSRRGLFVCLYVHAHTKSMCIVQHTLCLYLMATYVFKGGCNCSNSKFFELPLNYFQSYHHILFSKIYVMLNICKNNLDWKNFLWHWPWFLDNVVIQKWENKGCQQASQNYHLGTRLSCMPSGKEMLLRWFFAWALRQL